MKSALFVDFDNVHSGLRRLEPAAAERFATRPAEWLTWLSNSLALPEYSPAGVRRRLLVRRCYLNPHAYQRFRPAFNQAGFEIVDCPALTSGGKTSTDIHMVLDMVDLLLHQTHYDEFIVFSADADFTPVLRRLRRWDRRTTVLAIGFPSAAYRASADLLIDQDEFIRKALQIGDEPEPAALTPLHAGQEVAAEVQRLIAETVARSGEPVSMAKLAALISSRIEGIDAASWEGHGTFRGFIESLSLAPLLLSWEGGGAVRDPARHAPRPSPVESFGREAVEQRVAGLIRTTVAGSLQGVPSARLAHLILEQHGELAADWGGRGNFRRFIDALDLAPVVFDWNLQGGIAYDPGRHTLGASKPVPEEWRDATHLLPAARQLHDATGIPLLPPRKFRRLFAAIGADAARHPFHLMETAKRVRDQLKETGMPVSRADINYILRGLLFRGHAFEQGENDPLLLARKVAENVRALCQREQLDLDEAMNRALDVWIVGEREGERSALSSPLPDPCS